MKNLSFLLYACSLLAISGCKTSEKQHSVPLKVAATAIPHAEILDSVKPDLEKEHIDLEIIIVDDFNIPNRSLAEKEVDANYFQHRAFLDSQTKQFGYCLTPIAAIHTEPLVLYSKKYASIKAIPSGSNINIPNDPTNEARALKLLEAAGLISLKSRTAEYPTIHDIQKNPRKFRIVEVDAAMLPRTLDDAAASVIPTNFALQGGLDLAKETLFKEPDPSPYANLLVVRCGDENRPEIIRLKEALLSSKTQEFIRTTYGGAVLPAGNKSAPGN